MPIRLNDFKKYLKKSNENELNKMNVPVVLCLCHTKLTLLTISLLQPSYSPQKNVPFRLSGSPIRGATLPFVSSGNDTPPGGAMTLPSKSTKNKHSRLPHSHSASFTIPETSEIPEIPPPLPKRNKQPLGPEVSLKCAGGTSTTNMAIIKTLRSPSNSPARDLTSMFLDNEVNSNNRERNIFNNNNNANSTNNANNDACSGSVMVRNTLYDDTPPPLPPRIPTTGNNIESDAVNSISKQMTYPLVATCATLVNNYVSN